MYSLFIWHRLVEERGIFGGPGLLNRHLAYVVISADAKLESGGSILERYTKLRQVTDPTTGQIKYEADNLDYLSSISGL